MRGIGCWIVATALLVAGCAEESPIEPLPTTSKMKKLPEPLPAPPPPKEPAQPPYPPGGRMQLKSDPIGGPARADDSTRVKAEVGVGVKGRRLDDPNLVQTIVTPARALFRTQERVVFEITLPHALQLYEATNGRKPKTHEEFMEQIVKANQIKLPELPAGERYVYDPKAGELMVERPAPQ
jgi:hypothetical protein